MFNWLILKILLLQFLFTCLIAEEFLHTPIINTIYGPIRGKLVNVRKNVAYSFTKIPYASPPVKSLRFSKPMPPEPWVDILDTVDDPPFCMQIFKKSVNISEDCLFLNVYTPEDALNSKKKLPVMAWIHGGGFSFGASKVGLDQDGSVLAVYHNVIVVSFNYRLNAFGFLVTESIEGNFGLWDQLLALKWIQDNIAYFGGNPKSVTLFGLSAGAISIGFHILSPQSQGLFHRAILQSASPFLLPEDKELRIKYSKDLIENVGCHETNDTLQCLQDVDANKIIASLLSQKYTFMPIFQDMFLPFEPQEALNKRKYNNVSILIGNVDHEASNYLFMLNSTIFDKEKPQFSYDLARTFLQNYFSDANISDKIFKMYFTPNSSDQDLAFKEFLNFAHDFFFKCASFEFAHQYAMVSSNKVYSYLISGKRKLSEDCRKYSWTGFCHSDDRLIVFGIPIIDEKSDEKYSLHDLELSFRLMDIWTTFAKKGKTPDQGGVHWAQYKTKQYFAPKAMELNVYKLGAYQEENLKRCHDVWPLFLKGNNPIFEPMFFVSQIKLKTEL